MDVMAGWVAPLVRAADRSVSVSHLYIPACSPKNLTMDPLVSPYGVGDSYDGVRYLAGQLSNLAALLDANTWHLPIHGCHGGMGSPFGLRRRQICDSCFSPISHELLNSDKMATTDISHTMLEAL